MGIVVNVVNLADMVAHQRNLNCALSIRSALNAMVERGWWNSELRGGA